MNRSIGKVAMVLLVVAVLSGGMLSGASGVWAKEKPGTLAKQVQGSWTLVSIYVEQDGKKIEPFGSQPRGLITLTPDGRFSYIMLKASLPKIAADNRLKGTAEENQAIVQGSLAAYGTYKVVNEKEHAVQVHIEGSTFPNWDGQDQKRTWTVKGDELTITNPYASVGGIAYLVWKRAK
ncbi:MAG: lipocalin-like domain-containing protein [Desulfobaccales bacterium]